VRHWYWDLNSSLDDQPDCPTFDEDWDRDCSDEANDDSHGDAVQIDVPCTAEGTFTVTLTVWDDHNQQAGHGEHFETDQDAVVVSCIDTAFTFEPPPDEGQHENGTFETEEFVASDGTGNNITLVDAVFAGSGVDSVQVIYVFPPPAPYVKGYVMYKVVDHCLAGGTVSMTAHNDDGETLSGDFAIALANTDPVITCPPDESFDYADGYTGEASASDEDGDPLSFFKMDGPDALEVTAEGAIIWETGPGDVGGPYDVTVGVSDVCEATSACVFALTVTAPVGCCQHEDYCEMVTELECFDFPGTVWYPPPYECVEELLCQAPCGDCNDDRIVDVGDVVYLVSYLYKGGYPPDPECLGDVNCDGIVNIGDVVYLVSYLYKLGPGPCPDCCSGKKGSKTAPEEKAGSPSPLKKLR
jgi:hypothetical protein